MKKLLTLFSFMTGVFLIPQLTFAYLGTDTSGAYAWSQSGSGDNNAPTYNFNDISTTGTHLDTTSIEDDSYNWLSDEGVTIPASGFQFYGITYTDIAVSTNGMLIFDPSNDTATDGEVSDNTTLVNAATPNNIIAGLWTDLNPNKAGDIYAEVQGDLIIIQFQDVAHYYSDADQTVTFQYILDTTNGNISINYEDLYSLFSDPTQLADGGYDPSNPAYTIGIENMFGNDGIQVAYTNDPTDSSTRNFENTTITFFYDQDGDGTHNDVDCNNTNRNEYVLYYIDFDDDGERSATDTICADDTLPTGYLPITATEDPNDGNSSITSTDLDGDGVANDDDCNPGDSNSSTWYYADNDGDGLGNLSDALCRGFAPAGYVTDNTDRNDNDFDNDGIETGVDMDDADPAVGAATTTPPQTPKNTSTETEKTTAVDTKTVVSLAASETAGNITLTYSDDSTEEVTVFSGATKAVIVKYLKKRDVYLVFEPTYKSVVVYKDGKQVDSQTLSKKGGFKKGNASVVKVSKKARAVAVRMNKGKKGRIVLMKLNSDKTSDDVLVKATGKKVPAKIKLKKAVKVKKVAEKKGRQVMVKTKSGLKTFKLAVKKWKLTTK